MYQIFTEKVDNRIGKPANCVTETCGDNVFLGESMAAIELRGAAVIGNKVSF